MKKRLFALIYICAAALCLLLTASSACAQNAMFSAEEEAVFRDVNDGHYIRSRQKAEDLIKASPDSIGANYLMCLIFWNGEGNHHRALQFIKKTISLFEKKYCDNPEKIPNKGDLVSWHQRLYKELSDIYAELDLRELEFETHQKIADLYHAKIGEDAVWSMIKLGKYDEARAISLNSIQGHDTFWADIAYNNLVALEDARHQHMASFEASLKSVEFSAGKSCVVMMNHARALSTLLRLDESITWYLKAAAISQTDCVNHPLVDLSSVYLINGDWQKSISALTRVRQRKTDKRRAIQTEMRERIVFAVILFTMGFAEQARDLMTTVVNAPPRLGYDSLLKDQLDMANLSVYYGILQDALTRSKEALDAYVSLEPFWIFDGDIRPRIRELQDSYLETSKELWSVNQKLFKEVLNPENLKSFTVPYYILPTPNMTTYFIDAVGLRTGEFAINTEIKDLEPEAYVAMRSNFDYLRAYIAWRDGDKSAFDEAVQSYRKENTKRQKLLDREMQLMEADFMIQENNKSAGYSLLSTVYNDYPSVFRSHNVRLPVKFDNSMSAAAFSDVKKVLAKSERFVIDSEAPFIISGNLIGEQIQLCIASGMGQRFACSSTDTKDYSWLINEKPHAAEVINNFYHAVFAPRVDMSQLDINSLDGSTAVQTADEALKDLLNAAPTIKDDKKVDVSDLMDDYNTP